MSKLKNKSTHETHFHIVRHGETLWNRADMLHGRRDVSLSSNGYEMAKEKAQKFYDIPLSFIGTSPLLRAKMTGYIISQRLGIPNISFEELNARKYGPWEGKSISSLRLEYKELFNKMHEWDLQQIFKKSPLDSIESYEDISIRCFSLMRNLAQTYPNQHILFVTHCGLITALLLAMKATENEIPILALEGYLYLSYHEEKFHMRRVEGLENPVSQMSEKQKRRFFSF